MTFDLMKLLRLQKNDLPCRRACSFNSGLIGKRAFRSPHHHISSTETLACGRVYPKQGEVNLSHNGVLFLDV
jgi:predicted ATPase with chaperone activity